MEASASVKCPHCGADLQEYGVLEIQASGVDVDAEGRIAYEAKRRPLDEVEGYACSVCNRRLDFEDDPVAEYTQMRAPEDVSLVDDSVAEVRDDVVYSLRMNGKADAATPTRATAARRAPPTSAPSGTTWTESAATW